MPREKQAPKRGVVSGERLKYGVEHDIPAFIPTIQPPVKSDSGSSKR